MTPRDADHDLPVAPETLFQSIVVLACIVAGLAIAIAAIIWEAL